MPREITNHRNILEAITGIGLISDLTSTRDGHFEYELDLEVMVYGRNYGGKQIGPYLRLLEYGGGEEIFHQGDWSNTFHILVDGQLDVCVDNGKGVCSKVGEIEPESSFGTMSILTNVQHNATVVVPLEAQAMVLEVSRPALRLLRKLRHFGRNLDEIYREHLLKHTLLEIQEATGNANTPENLQLLIND